MKYLVFALALSLAGCATVHQAAILADQSFATAVFALDDAEIAAYTAHALTDAQHVSLNGPIVKALEDVKAVSQAIKDAPNGGLPLSLPALLKDLAAVQRALLDVQPVVPVLVDRAVAANTQALNLLTTFAGGK